MIKSIKFNFVQPRHGDEAGENYEYAEVEKVPTFSDSKVVLIKEHRPSHKGDIWFYDIYTEDDIITRVFNPNMVTATTK